jgi:uncharacterized membrane protein YkoI
MKHKFSLAALAAVTLASMGAAYAASQENDALAISGAKISLTQAVAAAEQHVGGKASRAEFERAGRQWVFDVEVVKDRKVSDVKVDPTSGKILAATEDKTDHDNELDPED